MFATLTAGWLLLAVSAQDNCTSYHHMNAQPSHVLDMNAPERFQAAEAQRQRDTDEQNAVALRRQEMKLRAEKVEEKARTGEMERRRREDEERCGGPCSPAFSMERGWEEHKQMVDGRWSEGDQVTEEGGLEPDSPGVKKFYLPSGGEPTQVEEADQSDGLP